MAEVVEAQWIDRATLKKAWEAAGKPTSDHTRSILLPESSGLPEKRRKVMMSQGR